MRRARPGSAGRPVRGPAHAKSAWPRRSGAARSRRREALAAAATTTRPGSTALSSAGREQPREGRPTNTEREGGHVGPPVHKVGADLCVGPMPMCLSEQELQTELNVPLAWTPAPRVAFACDPTERSARGIGLRVVEVDEVWEVERLAAQ